MDTSYTTRQCRHIPQTKRSNISRRRGSTQQAARWIYPMYGESLGTSPAKRRQRGGGEEVLYRRLILLL
ncbi:hypothetical protein Hypma_006049 [Hypsizygus marmoreus]|uniref:Uncharacterized protein n=1 Tax=Hypsizygus marmoreus TaxID=39966 RepID=A0A369JYY8_HYPMA|nr:hypothetical protein Hypma_006042 [Hypsizygus marmoreus]RDB26451.1 hypothetical protein Hypma_006049 [Hypsizygus marmoreus]